MHRPPARLRGASLEDAVFQVYDGARQKRLASLSLRHTLTVFGLVVLATVGAVSIVLEVTR